MISSTSAQKKPNVVLVLADQWRMQATGYAGDPNVHTPNLDALAAESISLVNAVSGCPVCSPYRASFMTGQRPLTHGVFVNDVCLRPRATTIAGAFSTAGYDTACIGKWHLDGHGRSAFIPPERRLGFDYWKVLECTHEYNNSPYYAGEPDEKLYWKGYDAFSQTDDAVAYIDSHNQETPFFLMLSWGPPHTPYDTAPGKFRRMYKADEIKLRPNVPEEISSDARTWLAGYYAHCSALDLSLGKLLKKLDDSGISDDTIFIFTSDHGDMLGSQGEERKQRPWDESIRVPFLLRYPNLSGWQPGECDALLDAPDIMPTLLGLCGIPIPDGVEGVDFSDYFAGGEDKSDGMALLTCPYAFGEWSSLHFGGREYRGIRTKRYTYVRDHTGPWMLFDNYADPCQLVNLVGSPEHATVEKSLEKLLRKKLRKEGDAFMQGGYYLKKWGYEVGENGNVPYTL